MDSIDDEIRFYKTHRVEFVKQYCGKYLVIKGMSIIGIYCTHSEAQEETLKFHEKGTYIIEHPVDLSAPRTNVNKR